MFCSKLLPSTHLWYHKILLFGLGYLYAYFDQSINFSKQSIQDIHTLEKHVCDTSKTLFPKWLLSQHRIQCVNSSLGEYFLGGGRGCSNFFVGEGMFPGISFLWEKHYHYGSGPLHTHSARNVWKHSFLGLTPARDQWGRKAGDNAGIKDNPDRNYWFHLWPTTTIRNQN